MVILNLEGFVDAEIGHEAWVVGHGPSLNSFKNQISGIKFYCNNWFDFLEEEPTYWVMASNIDTITSYRDKIEGKNYKVFYASSVDLESKKIPLSNVIAYDQRHFKGLSCLDILKRVKKHHMKTGLFTKEFGNNSEMFEKRIKTGAGFDIKNRCCVDKKSITIQELLMKKSGYNKHYSTADTVAIHMIALAIIMGCNPINVVGVDLDYKKGYANNKPTPNNDDWQKYNSNLFNDLKILNSSAKMQNIVINDCSNSNHNVFNNLSRR